MQALIFCKVGTEILLRDGLGNPCFKWKFKPARILQVEDLERLIFVIIARAYGATPGFGTDAASALAICPHL